MFRKWLPLMMVFLAVVCMGMGRTTAQGDTPRMEKEELKAGSALPTSS